MDKKLEWKRLVSNDRFDTRCFVACVQMVYERYYELIDNAYLDQALSYVPGKWMWPFSGFDFLASNGLKISYIDNFDSDYFIRNTSSWLDENYGKDSEIIKAQSDIIDAADSLRRLLKAHNFTHLRKAPSISDIRSNIDGKSSIIVGLNAGIINDKDSYIGHNVIVENLNEFYIEVIDPGLPAERSRLIDLSKFISAWRYPSANDAWMAVITQ